MIDFFFLCGLLVSLSNEMVWLLRSKSLKKPVVLVSAACTSVLVGVMVFDRILSTSHHSPHPHHHHQQHLSHHSSPPHPKHCVACTNTSAYPSYAKLRNHEATRLFKNSVIKRTDVAFLGSNSPIEDRFVVGISENLGGAFFSVIDGHKGTHCAQFLQENMLQHISEHLHRQTGRKDDDLEIVLDMDLVDRETLSGSSDQTPRVVSRAEENDDVAAEGKIAESAEDIEKSLRESLSNLDQEMSAVALAEVKLILSGHSMTEVMKKRIMAAVDGACAITAMVRRDDIFVANTGDCRAVLGQKRGSGGSFRPLPLSDDQNAQNPKEVERVRASHPGEAGVIVGGRVLGGLMPFRTFGDVDYKWERKHLQGVVPMVPNYRTPPYVTAEPVLTRHQLTKEDKFLILATDGFWERVSNQEAVDIVGGALSRSRGRKKRSLKSIFGGREDDSAGGGGGGGVASEDDSAPCCKGNAATELLWRALGGKEEVVDELLHIDPAIRRMYRDDITIMVVYL